MVIHGKEKVAPKSEGAVAAGGLQIEKERDWRERRWYTSAY